MREVKMRKIFTIFRIFPLAIPKRIVYNVIYKR